MHGHARPKLDLLGDELEMMKRCTWPLALAVIIALAACPAAADASVMTRGLALGVPATLNADSELDYAGTSVSTIANGQGVIGHVSNGNDDSHASGTPSHC